MLIQQKKQMPPSHWYFAIKHTAQMVTMISGKYRSKLASPFMLVHVRPDQRAWVPLYSIRNSAHLPSVLIITTAWTAHTFCTIHEQENFFIRNLLFQSSTGAFTKKSFTPNLRVNPPLISLGSSIHEQHKVVSVLFQSWIQSNYCFLQQHKTKNLF